MKGISSPPQNRNFVILGSASRTLTAQMTSQIFRNTYHRGLYFYLNITTRPAAETLVVSIDYIDPISGDVRVILDSTGIGAADIQGLVYPGMIDSDAKINIETGLPLPQQWQWRAVPSDSGAWVFSVGGQYIL